MGGFGGAGGEVGRQEWAGDGDVEGGGGGVAVEGGEEEVHFGAAVGRGAKVAFEFGGEAARGGEGGGDDAEDGLVAGYAVAVSPAAHLVVGVGPRVAKVGVVGGEGPHGGNPSAGCAATRELVGREDTEEGEAEAVADEDGEGEVVDEDTRRQGVEEEELGRSWEGA